MSKTDKTVKEWITSIIIAVSTFFIIFNNVGQSFQLLQIPLSKEAMYWIAGTCLFIGIVWESYLNKILKL